MAQVYLYETTALTDLIGTEVDIRMCQGRGYNHPSAPGYYEPVLTSDTGARIVRSIYADRLNFGLGTVDAGVVTAVSTKGQFDWMDDAGFGKPAKLLLGDDTDEHSNFTTVIEGRAIAALVGEDTLQIGWEDKTAVLRENASLGTYAGTNSGVTGLEGLATDIAGQRKARGWGKLIDIAPVLVNAPNRTYGWNNTRAGARAPSYSVDAVRVRGSDWTFDQDYANAALLEAASITVGYYATCIAESLVRMGGSTSIDGDVRIDATIGDPGSDENYAGFIINELLEEAGETGATINTTELAALDTAKAYTVGYYTQNDTIQDVIDALLGSILAYGVVDTTGIYRFGFVPATTGTPAVTLRKFGLGVAATATDVNIVSLEPVLETSSKNVPAKSVQIKYGYRWDVQDKANLASGLTDAEKAELSTQWRTTDEVTNGIEAKFSNADAVIYNTFLTEQADAEDVADDLLAIVGIKPKIYKVTVTAQPDTINLFRPGMLLDIYYPRFGLQAGYQFFATRVEVNTRARQVTLIVRGVGSV